MKKERRTSILESACLTTPEKRKILRFGSCVRLRMEWSQDVDEPRVSYVLLSLNNNREENTQFLVNAFTLYIRS